MAASFNKNGIVSASVVEAADRLSIYRDDIVVNPNLMVGTSFSGSFLTGNSSKTGWSSLPLTGDSVVSNITRSGLNSIHRYRSGTTATSWSELSYYQRDGNTLVPGNTYTFSIWVYTDNASWLSVSTNTFGSTVRFYDSSGNKVGDSFGLDLKPSQASVWEKKYVTYTIPSSLTHSWWYRFFTIPRDVDVYFTEPKLEAGSVCTPWVPNSADGYGTIVPITLNSPIYANELIEY